MTWERGRGAYSLDNELELTKKRLAELSRRAYDRGICTFSEFLTPGEQTELGRMHLAEPCVLDGGYSEAERRAAVFGRRARAHLLPRDSAHRAEICRGADAP